MMDLGIPLAFALLLVAVALLFAKKPRQGRKDWPLLLAHSLVAFAAVLLTWLWQYSKLIDGIGIFRLLGPKYGLLVLTGGEAIFFMALMVAVWKDFSSDGSR